MKAQIDQAEGANSRGLIYVAWGDKCLAEAAESARHAKSVGGYPCALVADETASVDSVFDHVIRRPLAHNYRDKILMCLSPFQDTIFLDSDTRVVASLEPLFALFRRFDLFAQPATGGVHYTVGDVPILAFPEISAGVIGFRRNNRVQRFFELWDSIYDKVEREQGEGAWDQRSLRAAAWESDVRLTYISHEWQCCTYFGNILLTDVKIFHGRGIALDRLAAMANAHLDYRFVLPGIGYLPLYMTTTRQYARFTLALLRATAKRGLRRALHYSGVWRLPTNQRPM